MSLQKCLSFHELYKVMLGKGRKNEIAELTEHIQLCQKCRLELSFIEGMYKSLQKSLDKKEDPGLFEKHISAATKEAYFQNTLPDSVKDSVHRHLVACHDCFAEFQLILGNDLIKHMAENSLIQKIEAAEIPDRLAAYKRQFIIDKNSTASVFQKLITLFKNREGVFSLPRIATTIAAILLVAFWGYQQISFHVIKRTGNIAYETLLNKVLIKPDGIRPVGSSARLVGDTKSDKLLPPEIQKARIEIEKALERKPNHARLNHQLGTVYFFAGDMRNAEKYYLKALSLDGKNAEIYNDLALINIDAKEYDTALNQLTKALSLDPKLLEAQYNLAIVFELKNETSKAIEAWEKYLQMDTHSEWNKLAQRRLQKLKH